MISFLITVGVILLITSSLFYKSTIRQQDYQIKKLQQCSTCCGIPPETGSPCQSCGGTNSREEEIQNLKRELSTLKDVHQSAVEGAEIRINDLQEEIKLLRWNLQPIVQAAFGSYNRWRHVEHNKPGLIEAQEFFRDYLRGVKKGG